MVFDIAILVHCPPQIVHLAVDFDKHLISILNKPTILNWDYAKPQGGLPVRVRILNLPLMVGAVLTLLWRQVAGVQELTRLLARRSTTTEWH